MDLEISDASADVDASSLPSAGWDFRCDFEVDYGSNEHADIVYTALAVDKELQPDKVKRQMAISDGKLKVHFEATEARFLRASFSSFVDLMILTTQLIEEYGQKSRTSDLMSSRKHSETKYSTRS